MFAYSSLVWLLKSNSTELLTFICLVGNPHLTAKVQFVAPFPTSTKFFQGRRASEFMRLGDHTRKLSIDGVTHTELVAGQCLRLPVLPFFQLFWGRVPLLN